MMRSITKRFHAVRCLVSDEAALVNGTVLEVDGGIVGARVG